MDRSRLAGVERCSASGTLGQQLIGGMAALTASARARRATRPGFTLIELLLVVVVGAVLTGMAVGAVSRHLARQNAGNARDTLVHLAVRARASAIERGRVVRLELDPSTELAQVIVGADVLESVRYGDEYDVDVMTGDDRKLTVCYTPRGFASPAPCTTVPVETAVLFRSGSHTSRAVIKPLGQVVRE